MHLCNVIYNQYSYTSTKQLIINCLCQVLGCIDSKVFNVIPDTFREVEILLFTIRILYAICVKAFSSEGIYLRIGTIFVRKTDSGGRTLEYKLRMNILKGFFIIINRTYADNKVVIKYVILIYYIIIVTFEGKI